MSNRVKVVCLTPVKNEAWILEQFLTAASEWADHIIVADQGSDDGSKEIALRFPKVELLENLGNDLNEADRQALLIGASRRIPGPRLLIALDADEFLTANATRSMAWSDILRSEPGTTVCFQWACVLPDRERYYIFPSQFPLGFMDDGSIHHGELIHGARLPVSSNQQKRLISSIKVLHLSITDWSRFKSKVRWYQTWEFLKGRWEGRLVDMYRFYHGCFSIPEQEIHAIPDQWIDSSCIREAINGISEEDFYRWDIEMIRLMQHNGTRTFRKIPIWDVDWESIHRKVYGRDPIIPLSDPRSDFERWVQEKLEKMQIYYSIFPARRNRFIRLKDRIFQNFLKCCNW